MISQFFATLAEAQTNGCSVIFATYLNNKYNSKCASRLNNSSVLITELHEVPEWSSTKVLKEKNAN